MTLYRRYCCPFCLNTQEGLLRLIAHLKNHNLTERELFATLRDLSRGA